MNKKVLSAILFSALFAGTGTFTSCIDNDEPAGIEELRGAKAELLRAKVAVEQAQASLLLAQAEVEKAKAAKKMADAEISKSLAAINQAKADSINAVTEKERAELEKTIAENKIHLDSMQVLGQIAMNKLNASLAESQRSYELMLAQIEIAKAVGSSANYVTISELQWAVRRAQFKVERAQEDVNEAQLEYNYYAAYDETHGELLAERFEAGTLNLEGIFAFNETLKYLSNIGMENIEKREKELRKYAISRMKENPNVIIYNENAESGIISFNYKGVFAQDEATYLNSKGICVRSGQHCAKLLDDFLETPATIRASIYFYNDESDIDALVEALKTGGDYLDAYFN